MNYSLILAKKVLIIAPNQKDIYCFSRCLSLYLLWNAFSKWHDFNWKFNN